MNAFSKQVAKPMAVALCRGNLSAVPLWGNHQDRTASPTQWLPNTEVASPERMKVYLAD
ncbi:hypothetical protein [Dendronalium sp. ChiSLP03b]|uniref:hypothetical protein n=1 Tax=Dendronalium sp. ChiSLP03b TaxID=3075381 RepID=UPI002AD5107A|nr:hypothetical protein [Dendronalium sp. ChiSLP03b]MDZ8202836.1 hypothetical protein [Dendronalium sp. ChiSLP03b]